MIPVGTGLSFPSWFHEYMTYDWFSRVTEYEKAKQQATQTPLFTYDYKYPKRSFPEFRRIQ